MASWACFSTLCIVNRSQMAVQRIGLAAQWDTAPPFTYAVLFRAEESRVDCHVYERTGRCQDHTCLCVRSMSLSSQSQLKMCRWNHHPSRIRCLFPLTSAANATACARAGCLRSVAATSAPDMLQDAGALDPYKLSAVMERVSRDFSTIPCF